MSVCRRLALPLMIFCLAMSLFAAAKPAESVKVPIIMYHNISEKQKLLGKFCVSVKEFEKDLQYIQKAGFTTVTAEQLINYVLYESPLPEKPILITFDDGHESFYTYALPLLEKYNMTATMAIIGEYTDLFTEKEDHNVDYSHLNWEQVKELTKSEHAEIANHSYAMHQTTGNRYGCNIRPYEGLEAYKAALYSDVLSLQKKTFEETAYLPQVFAYPFGAMCAESIDILSEIGFLATFSCTEKVNVLTPRTDCLQMLGRFNRPHGESTEAFFKRLLKSM